MHKPILVVVDMQRDFEAAHKATTIAACQKLILDATIKLNPIMFVEYTGNGPTLPSLTQLTGDFEPKFHVAKRTDDGSRAINEQLARCKVDPIEFIVCGVNTGFCVFGTVQGLHVTRANCKIKVIEEACNDQWGEHAGAIKRMRRMKRVEVV